MSVPIQMFAGVNGTPERRTTRCERATLPGNQLKSADIFDARTDLNLHGCKEFLVHCLGYLLGGSLHSPPSNLKGGSYK